MLWIIDCSFSSALFLPDEKSNKITTFFSSISDKDELLIPLLWWYETSNVLTTALMKKRLNYSKIVQIISLLEQFNFITDTSLGNDYMKELFNLSQLHGLSSYDSAYLELALRKKGTLATLDEKLYRIGKKIGVKLFEI